MGNHTPGPWNVAPNATGLDVKSAKDHRIASVLGMPSIENSANARLIAAAPDLLEALAHLLNMVFIWKERMPSRSTALNNFEALPEVEAARAAITKAGGKEVTHG